MLNKIIEKMIEFNTLLERNNKAESYFNDDSIPAEQKQAIFSEYESIIRRLQVLYYEITELGYTFKQDDTIYGIGKWD